MPHLCRMNGIEPGLPIDNIPENFKAGFIAIIGKPNVGKSTLMNALVGEKLSIVSHKASTTRNRIYGILSGENYQLVYSDTPGIIQPAYELQKSMMHFVENALEDADMVLAVTDCLKSGTDPELLEVLSAVSIPVILVINKIDKSGQEEILEKIEAWKQALPKAEVQAISAKEKFNLDGLLALMLEKTPLSPPYYPLDQLTEQSERFIAAEMIREQVFSHTEKEIPYSTAVLVESFKDSEELLRISALLYVERNSQKAILLGHQGSTIKKIASKARLEMEKFFGKKVFLETFIKVEEDWRKEKHKLRRLGFSTG
jgi:GTP-binding protein Era